MQSSQVPPTSSTKWVREPDYMQSHPCSIDRFEKQHLPVGLKEGAPLPGKQVLELFKEVRFDRFLEKVLKLFKEIRFDRFLPGWGVSKPSRGDHQSLHLDHFLKKILFWDTFWDNFWGTFLGHFCGTLFGTLSFVSSMSSKYIYYLCLSHCRHYDWDASGKACHLLNKAFFRFNISYQCLISGKSVSN